MTRLVLELKKIQRDDKTLYNIFYVISQAEALINESDIDDVFESIVLLHQTHKNIWEKF